MKIAREKREAALAAAADARPEDLAKIAREHGLKSKRTLVKWIEEAKKAEPLENEESLPPESSSTAPTNDAADRRQEGDAEIVLSAMRFGVSFSVKGACAAAGLDMSKSELLRGLSDLTPDEEKIIRELSPSLVPAWEQLLKWVKKHGAAACGVLFLGLVIPRFVLMRKVASKVKELEKKLAELQAEKLRRETAGTTSPAAPPPVAPPAPPAAPAANGEWQVPTITMLPPAKS